MKNFDEILDEMGACAPAKEWAEGKDFQTVWSTCHRGEWMAWLVDELEIDKRLRVLVSSHCANTVRHLMTDERSRNAVDVCIRYGNGEATEEELETAREAAREAASDAASAASAAWAAIAASDAASDAAIAAMAAIAASDAASAASTEWVARGDARTENLQQTADIVRKYIPIEMMIEKLEISYP